LRVPHVRSFRVQDRSVLNAAVRRLVLMPRACAGTNLDGHRFNWLCLQGRGLRTKWACSKGPCTPVRIETQSPLLNCAFLFRSLVLQFPNKWAPISKQIGLFCDACCFVLSLGCLLPPDRDSWRVADEVLWLVSASAKAARARRAETSTAW
jgi:hypothetical protein